MIDSQWRDNVFAAIEKRDHQQLKELLLQLRTHLNEEKKTQKYKSYNDDFVIDGLFQRLDSFCESNYNRASFQAIYNFNNWLICNCKSGSDYNFSISKRFVYELADHISALQAWTANTNISIVNFCKIRDFFYSSTLSDDIIRYSFITFGIRQVLENKFRKTFGIEYIKTDTGAAKIRHDFFINFLFDKNLIQYYECIDNQMYSRINKIYMWTNHSIHNMTAPYSWEIWTALTYIEKFLAPPPIPELQSGAHWNINEKITIKIDNLLLLRDILGERLSAELKKTVTIYFNGCPEACIKDNNGDFTQIDACNKTYQFPPKNTEGD